MTARTRLALLSPVWAFAVNRSREAARLTATVRTMERDLTVVRAERDALRVHYELAVDQRDGARELLAAIASEPAWSEYDQGFLDDAGVEPA